MTIPPIVQAPWGPEVDGRRLLGEAVGFGRACGPPVCTSTSARRSTTPGRCRSSTSAIASRSAPRARPIFVRRRDDRQTYDAVFDRWWRQRNRRQGDFQAPPLQRPPSERGRGRGGGGPEPADARRPALAAGRGRAGRARSRPPATTTSQDDERHRGRRRRARRLLARRDAAPPRVRPDDAGRAARRRTARRPAHPAAGAAPDPTLRAALARPPAGAAGDVPPQPGDRRPAHVVGLATADQANPARSSSSCDISRLDGAPLAAAAALRPGPLVRRARSGPSRSCSAPG